MLSEDHESRVDDEFDDLFVDVEIIGRETMAYRCGFICRAEEFFEQLLEDVFFHGRTSEAWEGRRQLMTCLDGTIDRQQAAEFDAPNVSIATRLQILCFFQRHKKKLKAGATSQHNA
jgi:hypothetical protein